VHSAVIDLWSTIPEEVAPKKRARREKETKMETPKPVPRPITKELQNWWVISNCVTSQSYCSGTSDSGEFCVTQSFPTRDLQRGDIVLGEGVQYVLGNHSTDEDQIEDNFGPWPKKMKANLNAVHLQFRSLQSESITDFSTRLTVKIGGARGDHLSMSMLLFNTLKIINATEARKTIGKALQVKCLPAVFHQTVVALILFAGNRSC
jgi:hypothetical protein